MTHSSLISEPSSFIPTQNGAVRRAPTVWFTGLPSAGKTTIARLLGQRLNRAAHKVELLDGDAMRECISNDLAFSAADRNENIRRIGFIAELLARNGIIVLVAAVSPYREARNKMREFLGDFVEVYVNAPLHICEQRDTKGLYRRARAGELPSFTGINDPYEPPVRPEIECRTDLEDPEKCVRTVANFLRTRLGV
jgi:adenylylsulfate kinase